MVYFFSNKSCVPLLKLCYFILNLGSHAKQKIMSIVFIFVDYFVTAVWITGTVTLVTLTSDGCFPPDVFQVRCDAIQEEKANHQETDDLEDPGAKHPLPGHSQRTARTLLVSFVSHLMAVCFMCISHRSFMPLGTYGEYFSLTKTTMIIIWFWIWYPGN